MRVWVAVGCNLAFILVDTVISTVLYVQGSTADVFADDVQDFDMHHSVLDLWGTLLVRVCILLGGSIGVVWNKSDGPKRAACLDTPVVLTGLVILTYALAKLLVFSEQDDLMHDPWFLGLFFWTVVAALATMFLWKLLATLSDHGVADREESEEREQLVDERDEGEEEEGGTSGKRRKGAKKQPNSGATLGQLLSYCKKDTGLLTIAFFFLLLSAVCESFIPYFTGKAIDGIVIHKSMDYFAKPMIILSLLALFSSVAIGVRGGVFSLTFARLNIRLRDLLFRSLMHQEIGFFDANHTGDITSRLTSDTTEVSDLISQNVNLFLRNFVKGVGFLIFMFSMSWKLSLVTLMGFPYIGVVSKLYGDYYKKLTKDVQTSLAHANKLAEETISAMRTVRSFANEEQESNSYYERLLEVFRLNKKQALAYACFMWSTCISELALQVAMLFYGGHLVITGQISGGTLISFIVYVLELGECLECIGAVYTGLMQGVGAAEKVFEYIDRKPKQGLDGLEAPDSFSGLVEFKNVTFAYPTRPEMAILKDVSFSIRPGEVTALVGPSGSGKSSCVCLLENFYSPQCGQVLLDGRPVQIYQHGYLHSKVAMVGQEPALFARSVLNNISYGLSDTPMDTVIAAATKANAHDFICSLPKGYDTGVGEKGAQLSGGQKQRVAIARALIRNPCVLVLDEATSALDAESEHVVQQALSNVMENRTVLVIAHRLSTVERAHSIIVLDKGSVVEQGQHAELMARGGLYCRLVQRQVLGVESVPKEPSLSRKAGQEESEEESSEDDHEPKY
ncbi:ATP-binding cassette sub-family B member 9 [Pygocentrus nattereri]|uniref:ABC-type oligopeptide transporter ABCB9 n=1 Tax=Pygocentrus nattereri TaxID=42514 RepID=A0AAR2JW44_PYGNA|nr:ATP-binding cassette sub-family B member 9 [Pygocentrus nattereri]